MLKVRLLGDFEARRDDGSLIEWPNAKTKALFQILVSDRGRHYSQDRLIERIWPDAELQDPGANLRNRVSELRQLLEPNLVHGTDSQFILTEREGYCFSREAACDVDLEAFERHLYEAERTLREGAIAEARESLSHALQFYQGDYLPDVPYEDWALEHREHWRQRYHDALEQSVELNVQLGDLSLARGRCHQLLEQDPYRESAWRQLMHIYWAAGERGKALQTFERCRDRLAEGLGEDPSPITQELYDRLRQGQSLPDLDGIDELEQAPLEAETPHTGELPLVGREAEVRRIRERLQQVQAGRGGLVAVVGEAGIGKTRLVQDVLKSLSQDDWHLLSGHCPDLETPPALTAPAEALRNGIAEGQINEQTLEDLPEAWIAELAEWMPELSSHLTELPPAPNLPPELKRSRLFEALSQLLLGMASQRPLLLVLDDLHAADSSTLDWLKVLMPRAESASLLALGTARVEELQGKISSLKQEGTRRGWWTEYSLDRLDTEAMTELAHHLSDQPELARFFADHTQGNPFFITAMLGFMAEQGWLRATPDHDRWELAEVPEDSSNLVPPEVQELLRQRLDHLQRTDRQLLYLAAVFGTTLSTRHLWQAWGASDFDVLERLFHRRLLMEHGDEIAFAHALLREVVYADMSDARRRALHGHVAGVLAEEDVAAVLLFHHYEQSDHPSQAIEPGFQALEQAHRDYQNDEALRISRRLLELVHSSPDVEDRREELAFEIRSHRFDTFGLLGRRSDQQRELDGLFELADHLGAREQCQVHRRRAVIREAEGRMTDAQQDAAEALALAPDETEQAESRLLLGNFALDTGDLAQAREAYRQALELYESSQDDRGRAQALNNLGIVHYYLGSYEQAQSYYEQALALSRELDDRREVGKVLNNLGDVYGLQEDWERAQSSLDESVRIRREIGDRRGELITLANLGELAVRRDDSGQACGHLSRAVDLTMEQQLPALEAAVRARLAWARLVNGESDDAYAEAQQALAFVEEDQAAEFAPEIYFRAFQVFDECDSSDDAVRILRKAHEQLQDRAADLPEAFQTRFLEGVLTHREILQAYQDRLQPQN